MLNNNQPEPGYDLDRVNLPQARCLDPGILQNRHAIANKLNGFDVCQPNPIPDGILAGDDRYLEGLRILLRAMQSADELGRPHWDFAIEISELINLGIGKHLLRVMVCQGVVEHRRETTSESQDQRSFIPEKDVVLSDRSCFVLNDLGRRQLETTINRRESSMAKHKWKRSDFSANGGTQPIPIWNAKRRELWLGKILVKQFKWPALNQEQVLRAFQEEGWPNQIDDPLLPNPQICPKRRLHDTIKCLNRRQVNNVIKFRGDGTGHGVLVEIRRSRHDGTGGRRGSVY